MNAMERQPLKFSLRMRQIAERSKNHPKPINMSSKVRETVFDTSRYRDG
ncbi:MULTISPECIES: hypothetical protein [unclassified Achromobacter]|nr:MULTISPECIES: hypothetical protein [unclassified Achromobacter]